MGFFATFSTWLDGMLLNYIGTNTAKIATLLGPAILTFAIGYVMIWGYLQLTGKIEEPVVAGLKRIILLVVILGGALNLWLYNNLIVDTVFRSPANSPPVSSAPTTRLALSIRSSSRAAMQRVS